MIHNIDPIFFSIGNLHARYYGVLFMSGFLFIYLFLNYTNKRYLPGNLTKIDIDKYLFFVIIFTIIGARLFEIFFYSWSYLIRHPKDLIAIWKGGLSFHGGFLGASAYTAYFCRKMKINVWIFYDYCSMPTAFALFLGRIANFINGELYGLPVHNQVNPPWYAVKFLRTDPSGLYRIPTQLWESFGNLLSFFIVVIVWRILKKKYQNFTEGLLAMLFLFLYSLFRFIVEFWKDYERNVFLGLTTGQLLCLPFLFVSLWGCYRSIKKIKRKLDQKNL